MNKKISRRKFLIAAGLVSGAAGIAVIGGEMRRSFLSTPLGMPGGGGGSGTDGGGAVVIPSDVALVNDSFTDTDATLLSAHVPAPTNSIAAAWTASSSFTIDGNAAKWGGAAAHTIATFNPNTADMIINAILVKPAGANRSAGIVVRGKDQTNFNGLYLFEDASPSWDIFTNVDNTYTSKASKSRTLPAGSYYCSLLARGTTIMANVNGDLIKATGITENQAEKLAGIWGFSQYHFDDFYYLAPKTNLLLFDGDSLTAGAGLTVPQTWPHLIHAKHRANMWGNLGVSGYAFAEANADVATRVDPLFTRGFQNIEVVWYGCNDLRRVGSSAATTYADLISYVSARRAAGANKVIACTLVPAGDSAAITYDFETKRQAYNALIRADHSFLDGVADVGGASTIGAFGQEQLANYFQADHLHPNAAGAVICQDVIERAVWPLMV